MVSCRSSITGPMSIVLFTFKKVLAIGCIPISLDVSPGICFSVVRHAPDDCILNDRTIVRSACGMAVET